MESNSVCNHDLLITSMITDWIGRHDVLLPINQNYDKIRETNKASIERWTILKRYECWKTQQFTQQSAPQQRAQKWRVLSNYKHDVCNCPINAQIRLLIANHVREFCYSFDYNNNYNIIVYIEDYLLTISNNLKITLHYF